MAEETSVISPGLGREAGIAPRGKRDVRAHFRRHWMLYVMLIPAVISMAVFNFYPMWGILFAFKKYSPVLGFWKSPWVGFDNFTRFLTSFYAPQIFRNTLWIAVGKIVAGQLTAILFSLALNEVLHRFFKRTVQTLTTLSHFLSWIIIGGMMVQVLSTGGIINKLITSLGGEPVRFLSNSGLFPWTMIVLETWKEFGWGAVIYLAALTNINPELYEAAAVDGAGRFQRMWHITLPSIKSLIILMSCLSLGGILSAGFEQILVLYNPVVYTTGDILDTYIYRVGLVGVGGMPDYSLGAAVGLLRSGVGFVLILLSYWLADRFANYRVF